MINLQLTERELLVVIVALEDAKRAEMNSEAAQEVKEMNVNEIVAIRNKLRNAK